jgi:hypothetical protein
MSIPMPVGGVHTCADAVHRMVAALGIPDTTRRRMELADLAETVLFLVRDEADQLAADLADADPYADVPM